MRVHHCPRCELRFRDEAEAKDHLVNDHGVDPERLERRAPGWNPDAPHREEPDLVNPTRRNDRS